MSFIQEYLDENSSVSVRSRGEKIYNQKRIISNKIDTNANVAEFKVRGTGGIYNVMVSNFTNSNITSRCTCPYDWGDICKHEVAALLHLDKELNNGKNDGITTQKIIVHKRKSSTPYYIKDYQSLTTQKAYENFSSFVQYYNTELSVVKLYPKESKIEFLYKDYFQTNFVKIHLHTEKGLGLQCDCNQTQTKLCKHESFVLHHLVNKIKYNDFIAQLNPNYIDNKKKEVLKEFGLPEDISFEDYFSIEIVPGNIIINPINKGLGLHRLKNYRKADESDMINSLNILIKNDHLRLPAGAFKIKEDIEERKMGYVLILGGVIEDHVYPQIIPIYGKPNKNGDKIVSNINSLYKKDNHSFIRMTDEDKLLISFAKNLSRENATQLLNNSGFLSDNAEIRESEYQKFYLEQLKQIVPLLENQPNVFLYNYFRNISVNNYNLRKSDFREISVSTTSFSLSFHLFEHDEMIVLEAFHLLNGNEQPIELRDPKLSYPFLFTKNNDVYHLNNSLDDSYWLEIFGKQPIIKIVKSEFDNFFEDLVKPISKKFPIKIEKISDINIEHNKLLSPEKQLYLSEIDGFIIFKPFIAYQKEDDLENTILVEISENNTYIEKCNSTITSYEIDIQYEQDFIAFLKSLHPKFEKQHRNDFIYLPIEDLLNNNWFFGCFEQLKKENITVFGYNQLKSFKYSPFKANIKSHLKSGEDWFDISISVSFGDIQVSLKDVQKAVLRKERYIKLSDGSTGVLPEEWFEKLEKYFRHGDVKNDEIKISKLRFSIIDELFENIDNTEILQELIEKKQKLLSFKEIQNVEIPKEIKAQLRDYQKDGFSWLNFLHEFKWGGILADDMGLGKTLQALTFLVKMSKKSKKANLIVMPTSLMFNWENEISKFAPEIKVMFYHGNNREKEHTQFNKYQIVLTTYGLMARDIEMFSKYKFNYIILDESQAIKNPLSQRFKAACLLHCENRIALTGTPIENNTFDLFAQMSFLNPGFLGNANSFKDTYSIPIDSQRNTQRAAELQKLINPFVLRRTKEQVEKDLPDKTEDVIYCEMEKEQRKVYDAFRNKYRNFILKKVEEDGLAKSKIYVLEGLTKLRQICDSPEILSEDEKYISESIKMQELLRHINEKTGKHKLLVFSQFVTMLHLIQNQLEKNNIQYEYLDGQCSITERQKSVNHFQSDESCRVFLISLKAGGMGINLTAADYVYLVDPWWNPAVENQAIDRCHRIGQDKKVIAYRMICKNTVEEKIMKLQAKKKQIAADIIQTDESVMKSLSKSDIEQLFE